MPEQIQDKKVFTLLDVTRSIKKTLTNRYGSAFWVQAEMIRLNHYPHSGHCYPDLVEKRAGKVVAQLRAVLWRKDHQRINKLFYRTLKEPLKDGIKILFLAKIDFDSQYGLSLHLLDIDPAFTLGDLEREKQETIGRLKAEGLFYKNKQLPLALLPHRIAIISVETSKGFADFKKVIAPNEFGYAYFYFLFPALLQGDNAIPSLLRALERIRQVLDHFDMVAIIRGGGGDIGLSCYNDYGLNKAIANFPLPVITGIGHATNETVAELIAFENCITPTKMAQWLLQRTHQVAVPVERARKQLVNRSTQILNEHKDRFKAQTKYFKSVTLNRISSHHNMLARQQTSLGQQTLFLLKQNRQTLRQKKNELDKNASDFIITTRTALKAFDRQVKLMDPVHVLKRGYSIAYANNKVITSTSQVKPEEELTTVVADGVLKSRITHKQKNTPDE